MRATFSGDLPVVKLVVKKEVKEVKAARAKRGSEITMKIRGLGKAVGAQMFLEKNVLPRLSIVSLPNVFLSSKIPSMLLA